MRIQKRKRMRVSALRQAVWGSIALLMLLGSWLASAQDGVLLPSGGPVGQAPPEPGLVWRFDEGQGIQLSEVWERAPQGMICGARWTPGLSGSGLQFDGVDDFVLIPDSPAFSPRRAITLAAWVRLDRMPQIPWRNDFRFILAKPSLRAYSLVLEQNGTLNASAYVNGARQSVRTRESLPLGEWVHVTFTYDGVWGLGRLYWNGRLASERPGERGFIDANGDVLTLGSAFFSGTGDVGGGIRAFPGAIDELRLYPRALGAEEIERLARPRRVGGGAEAPPEPARLMVTATLDGQPTLARAVIRPLDLPDACPEVLYTALPLEQPAPGGAIGALRSSETLTTLGGLGETMLPPGEYAISLDRGDLTAAPVTRTVRLSPGETASVAIELRRQYDPRSRGYYGADLHVHTHASGDGVTPIQTAVWAQRAADLDLAVISDHDTAAGHLSFAEEAERLGMPYLLSEEITTSVWGHFNVFPLRLGEVVGGSREKTPTEYFSEARAKGARIVQVNHPLWGGGQGYFARMDDPEFDWGFQTVEVLNGFDGKLGETDFGAVQAVFELWTQGRRVTATGGSDDHNMDKLVAQVGNPRTYVYVDLKDGEDLTAERWLAALGAGRAFVTSGPLVYLMAQEGALLGSRLRAGGPLRLQIEVESRKPLRALRLWHNGRELRAFPLEGHEASIVWEGIARSGWYAVTVEAEDEGFALTNPIWVETLPAEEVPPAREGGER